MDEQTSPVIDPVIPPAGEANTVASVPEPVKTENPPVEPLLEISPETPVEALSAPEIAPEISTTEPIIETPTAQFPPSEPLAPPSEEVTPTPEPEIVPVPETPSAKVLTEEPQQETPTQGSTASEPTPPTVQQGSAQPEPTPAPAQIIVTPPRNIARLLLEKAKATIQLRKQKKLLKIMTLFEKKNHITNDEVEKLLHVSDATATRYLSELEKQGRIIQSGKTGHAVTYTKR